MSNHAHKLFKLSEPLVIGQIKDYTKEESEKSLCELPYEGTRFFLNTEVNAVINGEDIPYKLKLTSISGTGTGRVRDLYNLKLMFIINFENEWFLLDSINFLEGDSLEFSRETDIPENFDEYVNKIIEMKQDRDSFCGYPFYSTEEVYELFFNPYNDQGECRYE